MGNNTNESNIVDINLSATRRKRIRIDGDDNRIVELNTSDMSIISRLSSGYPRLEKLSANFDKVIEINDEDGVEGLTDLGNVIADVDSEMRQIIDFIFDSNVSEVCAPHGSMYDIIDGKYRFEYILEALLGLYEENINLEYEKMANRINKHTDKYVKK